MDFISNIFPDLPEGQMVYAIVVGFILFVSVSIFNIFAVKKKIMLIWRHKS